MLILRQISDYAVSSRPRLTTEGTENTEKAGLIFFKDFLDDSIQEFSEDANKINDFLFTRIFNGLLPMKMVVHPCITGSSDFISSSINLRVLRVLRG